MLVLADVGNSRIKWALVPRSKIEKTVALPLPDELTVIPDTWATQIHAWQLTPPTQWVIASTNPNPALTLETWLAKQGFMVRHLKDYRDVPVRLDLDFPERVGIDRLLNALAAIHHGPPGQPKLIVDAGSAVTVDWVDAEDKFCGGAILPGFRLMSESLHHYTARLPLVKPTHLLPILPPRNTEAAIQAGMLAAIIGAIVWLRKKYLQSSRSRAIPKPSPLSQGTSAAASNLDAPSHVIEPVCFLTGGDAPLLEAHLDLPVTLWPEMTLEGLYLASRSYRIR
ncbi:Type III pantothenate kinase [bacterium HR36]|nr:Type III pantothenate kinase [bacterium HR36]